VRRVIDRPISSLLATLLILVQLLVGPFAHALPTVDQDCGPAGQASHQTPGAMCDCGDCPDHESPSSPGSAGGEHHCRTHAACTSQCAHTPALGAIRLLIASPTPPEAVATVFAVPAFDSPLFDFLRPPN
jgi:hypothetical protein